MKTAELCAMPRNPQSSIAFSPSKSDSGVLPAVTVARSHTLLVPRSLCLFGSSPRLPGPVGYCRKGGSLRYKLCGIAHSIEILWVHQMEGAGRRRAAQRLREVDGNNAGWLVLQPSPTREAWRSVEAALYYLLASQKVGLFFFRSAPTCTAHPSLLRRSAIRTRLTRPLGSHPGEGRDSAARFVSSIMLLL